MSHILGPPIRRGRPRASYAEMGEFDLSLIREFKNRPELYDRNSPLFKDKMLSAQRWQEISNKLGFDVALLKDRMLQLRNRYNIEKRRLEQLSSDNPNIEDPEASPWPLFEHLQFLADHIRPRRSYKRLVPNILGYEEDLQGMMTEEAAVGLGSRKHSYSSTDLSASYFANVEVKEEKDSDQTDEECGSQENPVGVNTTNHLQLLPDDHNAEHRNSELKNCNNSIALHVNPSITIRRIDTLRENNSNRLTNPYATSKISSKNIGNATNYIGQKDVNNKHQQQLGFRNQTFVPMLNELPNYQQKRRYRNSHYVHSAANVDITRSNPSEEGNDNSKTTIEGSKCLRENSYELSVSLAERLKLDARAHKYTAFGYFLSSLLEELPREKALDLVQKFTSEMVLIAARSDGMKNKASVTDQGSSFENEGTLDASSIGNRSPTICNGVNGSVGGGCTSSSTTDEEITNSSLLGM